MPLAKGYGSWSGLVADSTIVAVGVAGAQQHEAGRHGLPETITRFAVDTLVMARDGESHSVVYVQQIGPVPPNMWISDTWPLPVSGERYLLFLTPALRPGTYFPVGAYQGVYYVTHDDRLQSVMPGVPLLQELTREATLAPVLTLLGECRLAE